MVNEMVNEMVNDGLQWLTVVGFICSISWLKTDRPSLAMVQINPYQQSFANKMFDRGMTQDQNIQPFRDDSPTGNVASSAGFDTIVTWG